MISVYIWTYNVIKTYPIKACVKSALSLDGEVVVLDCGSTDGTLDLLSNFGSDVKVYRTQWRDECGFDGKLKTQARQYCSGKYCLQLDADEVIRKEDVPKLKKLTEEDNWRAAILGTINFVTLNKITLSPEAGTERPRFTVNNNEFQHAIPKRYRRKRADGQVYSVSRDTDGTNLVDMEENPVVPDRRCCEMDYKEAYKKGFSQGIYTLHYGNISPQDKVEHWPKEWFDAWELLYNNPKIENIDGVRRQQVKERITKWDSIKEFNYEHRSEIKEFYHG